MVGHPLKEQSPHVLFDHRFREDGVEQLERAAGPQFEAMEVGGREKKEAAPSQGVGRAVEQVDTLARDDEGHLEKLVPVDFHSLVQRVVEQAKGRRRHELLVGQSLHLEVVQAALQEFHDASGPV
jgi:hypothetical protein